MTRNSEFEKSLDLISYSLGGTSPFIPAEVLQRARLKSDAMRLMAFGPNQDMTKAEVLLTEALRFEVDCTIAAESAEGPVDLTVAPMGFTNRLRELHMLRAEARGSFLLKDLEGALSDLDIVIGKEPEFVNAHVEKAKILRRAQRSAEAIGCFKRALELGDVQKPSPDGNGLTEQLCTWIRRVVEDLETRAVGQAAGDCSGGDSVTDSGDGSGRWKVVKITGVSFDSCIYHLENHPPAIPHPHPTDAWHVSVRFGSTLREYTPISTAADWERGHLDLLVKTYPEGIVSRKFATLQPWSVSKGACWVLVTKPHFTLALPDSVDGKHRHKAADATGRVPPTTHICLAVGGTGVAPALQILREVADPKGAFGPNCRGTLLYSSRRQWDVLLLDELRALEASAGGRVIVWHTLTDHVEGPADVEAQAAAEKFRTGLSSLPCRHFLFASPHKPFKPKGLPLQLDPGEEGGLRGRITQEMCATVLPQPAEGVRVVVSGPPQMWEDIRDMCLSLGHNEVNLVELKAWTAEQEAVEEAKKQQQQASEASPVQPKPLSPEYIEDVKTRINAARLLSMDADALTKKALRAGKLQSSNADAMDVDGPQKVSTSGMTTAQSQTFNSKRSWGGGTSGSGWSSGGWSAGAWKSSGWDEWKSSK